MLSGPRLLLALATLAASAAVSRADDRIETEPRAEAPKTEAKTGDETEQVPHVTPPSAEAPAAPEVSHPATTTGATAPARDAAKPSRPKQRPAWPPPPEWIS
jgi:hypothetical protein